MLQNIFDILQERWSEYCLGTIWWGPKGLGKNFQAFSFHILKGMPIENLPNTRDIRNILRKNAAQMGKLIKKVRLGKYVGSKAH